MLCSGKAQKQTRAFQCEPLAQKQPLPTALAVPRNLLAADFNRLHVTKPCDVVLWHVFLIFAVDIFLCAKRSCHDKVCCIRASGTGPAESPCLSLPSWSVKATEWKNPMKKVSPDLSVAVFPKSESRPIWTLRWNLRIRRNRGDERMERSKTSISESGSGEAMKR